MLRLRTVLALSLALLVLTATQAQAAIPVTKAQRQAVVFVTDLSQGSPAAQAFYDLVEFGAAGLTVPTLGPRYANVTIVQGAAATRTRLRTTLKAAASASGVKAVDLVFVTHGLSGNVVFSGSSIPVAMTAVRDDIQGALTAGERAKLRMVFSTACFGASHNARWLEAGFKVASGGKRIYADSATSYPAFLGTWALGATFGVAVAAANASDPLRLQDNAAEVLLRNEGFPNPDVDSTRVVSGASSLTIATMP